MKALKINMTVKKGQMSMSPAQAALRRHWLTSLTNGTEIIETLQKRGKPKTWEQCKMHFGLALQRIVEGFDDNGWDCSMLLNLPDPTGVGIDKDMLQMFFYALFPTLNEDGERITLSKMDTKQESAFYEKITNFASSQWQIVIPEPQKDWKHEPQMRKKPESTGPKTQRYQA